MRIGIVNRALIKQIFEMDTIKIVGGDFTVRDVRLGWQVVEMKDISSGKVDYYVYVRGPGGQIINMVGDTLDEVLDSLESTMEELATA